MIFSNSLYQEGDPNDRELFSIFTFFHVGKTQFLTLSVHTFPKTNLEKFLRHLDHPIGIKKYYISFSS